LLNLASTSRMSNSVTRNLIKPLQHDPIGGKFNSQVINAWRFNTTAAALIGIAGFVVGAADLDPSDLSVIQRAFLRIAQLNNVRSNDAQSEKERLLLACAVQRRRFPVGASPTRQSLQPEAIGAVMEVTK
jgi:hypothetical protein